MRKLAVTGAILVVLGILLSFAALTIGFFAYPNTMMNGWWMGGRNWNWGNMMDWGRNGGSLETRDVEQTLDLDRIDLLEARLNILNLDIRTGDVSQPTLTYPETVSEEDRQYLEVVVEVQGNEVTITENSRENRRPWMNWGAGMFNNWRDYNVRLVLPVDFPLDTVNVDLAMGELNVRNLSVANAELDVDMGSATLYMLEAETSRVNLDMGSLNLDRTTLGDSQITVSMGSVKGNMAISGDVRMDCSMGSIELNLDNALDAIAYNLNADMGSITVNGEDLGDDATHSGGTEGSLTADVNMGSIDLDFAD